MIWFLAFPAVLLVGLALGVWLERVDQRLIRELGIEGRGSR